MYPNLKEVGVSVVKRDNEDEESLMRRFKKKVNKSGILKDLKKKDYFDKPSMAKRKKKSEAKKRLKRELQKEMIKKQKKYNPNRSEK